MIVLLLILASRDQVSHGATVGAELTIYKNSWTGVLPTHHGICISTTHLLVLQSDHKPLLFQSSPKSKSYPKPFKFKTFWTTIPEVTFIIQKAWGRGHTLTSKIKNTKTALKQWNKVILGNIHTKIEHLKASVQNLQAQQQTDTSLTCEANAQLALDDLLKSNELIWKDKAKVRWMEEGDGNTPFFPLSTIIHRRYNAIH